MEQPRGAQLGGVLHRGQPPLVIAGERTSRPSETGPPGFVRQGDIQLHRSESALDLQPIGRFVLRPAGPIRQPPHDFAEQLDDGAGEYAVKDTPLLPLIERAGVGRRFCGLHLSA
jgi:hypothetical protein